MTGHSRLSRSSSSQRIDGCKCAFSKEAFPSEYQMRRITVKFSLVRELRTTSHDQQRRPAFSSPSLRISVVMLILTVLVGIPAHLGAQFVTSADIVGLVTDPSRAVRLTASVTLKSQENGSTQAQSTNSRGVDRFSL